MLDYQRVVAEINLDNIGHNMREIRNRVDSDAKVLAIVKADAYGHGAVEVSKVVLYNGADWLGVAICDEGVQLRQNNILVPVLILGYTPEPKIEEVILNNLTQTVFSLDMAKKFSEVAKRLNRTANIHIKIDTGMSRIGFLPNEKGIADIAEIKKLDNLNVTGVFTHFSTADEKDKSFTNTQYERFIFMTEKMKEMGYTNIIRHCANSGAILDMPELKCDMVRAGIILYGLFPSSDVKRDIDLRPCMSLKTHISYIKEVEPNVGIGYNRTYYTNRKTKVATVPVGYADGYLRALSNKASVLVNGKLAPIIGNICMDQFMIDITDIADVKEDDEVVLIGLQNGSEITTDEIARLENTINYEVVCNIGKRVPRVYIRNDEILKTINYI